ncbi:MAG: putative lipoprotein [Acidobacteria bacterium ADurb.Bin340]|nr:MAG: putative lipoprotein [Acidobacteria bacterium ADurb.Bin340]
MKNNPFLAAAILTLITIGCRPPAATPKDYTKFYSENPKSILIIPVINKSVDVTASDYFLATISKPVAERGFYVYPINLVKRVLEDDGLADANLVHHANPKKLGELFGADAILYIVIDKWTAEYAVLSTSVKVAFQYSLKSGKTGEELWSSQESMNYTPQNSSSGNPLVDLISAAITAGVTKAAPNYIPLAQQANGNAIFRVDQGLPSGPYIPKTK